MIELNCLNASAIQKLNWSELCSLAAQFEGLQFCTLVGMTRWHTFATTAVATGGRQWQPTTSTTIELKELLVLTQHEF